MISVGTVTRISISLICLISLATPVRSQTLQGIVRDGSSGSPIADASVVLMDEDGRIQRGTLTEPNGSYLLQVPDDGTYTLRIGSAGYEVQDTPPFRVQEGETARVDILLMSEEAESALPAAVLRRIELGEGLFITREQIEERNAELFSDIFTYIPFVSVIPLPASTRMSIEGGADAIPTRFSRRSEAFIGASGQNMTVRIKQGTGVAGAVQQGEPASDCVPILWVDGIWWGRIDEASDYGHDGAIVPSDVEAIEVYNHPSILPDQFDTGRETLCGVIVVWRKKSNK